MTKNSIIITTIIALFSVFAISTLIYQRSNESGSVAAPQVSEAEGSGLIRPHSPILGRTDAPVTIVEFFDPSCEACKAFSPYVEAILEHNPDDVRVVLRYAPFHEGSDEAVRILEAARLQNLFEPVLKALFAGQQEWAIHGAPNLDKAWEIAGTAGLDITRAKTDSSKPEIADVLKQDTADIQTYNVQRTPTFFVNGKQLMDVNPQQLNALVDEEIKASKK